MPSALDQLREALAAARAGDPQLLGRELAARWPALLVRVRWMMGPEARRHAETTDFAQEMMVELLRALPAFELRDEAAFWAWLVTIARNRIGQVVRRHREHRFLGLATSIADGSDGDPSDRAAREDELQAMAQALEAMPDDRRRVIELRDLDGLSYREIGATLGRTENAVQILHARALAELARRLEP